MGQCLSTLKRGRIKPKESESEFDYILSKEYILEAPGLTKRRIRKYNT